MIAACTCVDGTIRGDQHAAFRRRRGDVAKALVHPGMEQRVEPLIPIGIGTAFQLARDSHRVAHIQHQRHVGNDAEQSGQRRDRRRGRRPGRSPDRPSSNRRTDRRPPTFRPPAPGGSSSPRVRRGRQNAAASRPARTSPPTSPSSRSRRISAPGAPPGSRVRSTGRPSRTSASASSRACVDLPAPSPPSSVMNRPKAMQRSASTRPSRNATAPPSRAPAG